MANEHSDKPFATGSTKQPTISPAGKRLVELESIISRLESELGLTPLARQRLGVATGQAVLTLEEFNRQWQEGREGRQDPRFSDASHLATDGGD